MEKYIKTEEVMELFGVSRQTLYVWRKKGILKAYCPSSGTVLYKLSDINELMQSSSSIADQYDRRGGKKSEQKKLFK